MWLNMIQRCENPNFPDYPNYGGRGISVCSEWRNDYLRFLDGMGERPSPEHQIDRRDNDKGYSPDNCRWATRSENMMNTRRAIIVSYNGEKLPLAEVCRKYNLNYHSAKWAVYRGKTYRGISP